MCLASLHMEQGRGTGVEGRANGGTDAPVGPSGGWTADLLWDKVGWAASPDEAHQKRISGRVAHPRDSEGGGAMIILMTMPRNRLISGLCRLAAQGSENIFRLLAAYLQMEGIWAEVHLVAPDQFA
ncbi:MAG: hypothetical protein QUV05_12150 [Phycisphaerae bacterium]|nr:hypothetical protein [Phycisphaerae bacterium]